MLRGGFSVASSQKPKHHGWQKGGHRLFLGARQKFYLRQYQREFTKEHGKKEKSLRGKVGPLEKCK